MNPLAPLDTHELRLSSMSEIDSFSDSDWLDISSNRESDDSLSSRGSDHNGGASSSLSRRSSFSTSSSRDGDVEAWEGFVDDSADEALNALDHHAATTTGEATSAMSIDNSEKDEDSAEERRVKEGLDQSLMSTLSASRSSGSHPSTVHNSLRDLRLSFPDPLTSSGDELNRSYDKVSPSDIPPSATETGGVAPLTMADSIQMDDPGLPPTPEVSDLDTETHYPEYERANFDIVLYGASSSSKWTFVYDLLQKDAAGSERSPLVEAFRSLGIESPREDVKFISNHFVLDRTESIEDISTFPRSDISPDRPSLAVVYLPCERFTLARHTLYLPVVVPRSDESFEKDFDQAQDEWSAQAVPMHKILRLEGSSSGLLFAAEDVDKLDPTHTHRALQRLSKPEKSGIWSGILEQFNSVHAVTLFALLCIGIAAGISVNNTVGFQIQPLKGIAVSPTSVTSRSSTVNGFNHSSAIAIRATTNIAVVSSSPNTPAVYSQGSTSASIPPASMTSSRAHGVGESDISAPEGSKLMSWAERMRASKDVIIRPPSSVVAEVSSRPSTSTSPQATTTELVESSTAVSLRLVNSLSEVVGASMKALIEVVHDDMKELILAIDELVQALQRQTRMVVEQSRSAVQIVREQIDYRNARAKGKAREFKERGLQLMSYAGNKFFGRTDMAKKRAHSLRDRFVSSYAWNAYTKGAGKGEWAARHTRNRLRPEKMARGRRILDFM